MTVYVPGTLETDPKKVIMSLQQIGPGLDTANANIAANSVAISVLQSGTVTTIAGNSGAFTLSHGLVNSSNDLRVDPGILRGHKSGLILSTAGGSSTFSVSPGVSVDSSQTDFMKLASSMSKTTGAWAAGTGNGSLDTGVIAASTWYWVFEIKNTTSGAVDILTTKSVAGSTPVPTLPSGYTIYRYIGSMLTDGSSHWTAFNQFDDSFYWVTAVSDVSAVSATSNVDNTQTLTVPLGVRVRPLIRFSANGNSQNSADIAIRSPDLMSAEASPSIDGQAFADSGITVIGSTLTRSGGGGGMAIYTNTSGQIVYRFYLPSGGSGTASIRTYGWIDNFGRYA